MGLFNYLFLLDSILVGCMFIETYLFLLDCQICWYLIIHSFFVFLSCFFVFLWHWLLCLLLYFLFCLFGFSLFFLVRLARDLSILFILSKNQFWVLIFFLIFLKSLFYFLSDLLFPPFC